jgi:hypothetical protein
MHTLSSAPAATQGTSGHRWTGRLTAALKRWWMAYITWRLEQVPRFSPSPHPFAARIAAT